MLSYETSDALREAGFPQYHVEARAGDIHYLNKASVMVYQGEDDAAVCVPRLCIARLAYPLACPNSDELLAAIRERWPFVILSIHDLATSNDTAWWRASGEFHDSCGDELLAGAIQYTYGPTPTAAIAALYIALAVGAVKEGQDG